MLSHGLPNGQLLEEVIVSTDVIDNLLKFGIFPIAGLPQVIRKLGNP